MGGGGHTHTLLAQNLERAAQSERFARFLPESARAIRGHAAENELAQIHLTLCFRAVRKIPFKSFEVLNWLWGWMDPSRVALNKATRESERSIVEEINEHHRIVSSTKEFRDVLGGMLVDPRQAVLRTMWKETHPRTYVMATESCEHERMPVVPGVVRAYLVCGFTVSPTPDGGCEVDYAISVNPKGSLP